MCSVVYYMYPRSKKNDFRPMSFKFGTIIPIYNSLGHFLGENTPLVPTILEYKNVK